MTALDTTITPALVTLTIPCAPEYVGTARLTVMSVAARLGFSVDMIEDIRMAVGEACTNAIERGDRSVGNGTGSGAAGTDITIRFQIEPSHLQIEVEDRVPDGETAHDPGSAADPDSLELGPLLMEILVDEFSVESVAGGGTCVRLVKHTAPDAEGVEAPLP